VHITDLNKSLYRVKQYVNAVKVVIPGTSGTEIYKKSVTNMGTKAYNNLTKVLKEIQQL
jgi:hypothetical protein